MGDINTTFSIIKNALLATQKSVSVVSHNIANANTEGYTKQRPVLENTGPVEMGGLSFGYGVDVITIERVYDSFLAIQVRDAISDSQYFGTKSDVIRGVEGILNDIDGGGLSAAMDDFFNAVEDVATNPASSPERVSLLSRAALLTDTFNSIDRRIRDNLKNIDKGIESAVDEINDLATRIRDINLKIRYSEAGGATPNDLFDKRDYLLDQLAELVEIKTSVKETGELDIYLGGGVPIVVGDRVFDFSAEFEPTGDVKLMVGDTRVDSFIESGRLKGLIDGRSVVKDGLERLNLLAAALTKEVNLQHRAGYGLDGSTGNDFFSLPPVTVDPVNVQGGAGFVGGSVTNLSAVTLDDYEIRFIDSSTYNVVNITDNTIVVSGATYTSGSPIVFDGISVTIMDISGTPVSGDRFRVSITAEAASNMSVSLTDGDKFAAASSSTTLPGDNTNALTIAGLRDQNLIEGTTFAEYHSSTLAQIGIAAKGAETAYKAQNVVTEQLRMERESVSGVSLEEEAMKLIQLQRAFEAAARVMNVADEMFEILVNL